jgi:cell surface protein SprA
MIESTSDEYIIGGGYILKDFNLILKLKSNKQTQVKNDLKLSVDLSWKDIKTLMRKIDESLIQPQTGNKVLSCKMMADYVFSSKVNFQLFFDYQSNTPLISSSFPISTTNFGISLKFMLTR